MKLFKKENVHCSGIYNGLTPAIRASICTGEKAAGFMDKDGKFKEVMIIRTDKDLMQFCREYGVNKDSIKTFW